MKLTQCLACNAKVKPENMALHMERQHGFDPEYPPMRAGTLGRFARHNSERIEKFIESDEGKDFLKNIPELEIPKDEFAEKANEKNWKTVLKKVREERANRDEKWYYDTCHAILFHAIGVHP